MSWIDDRLDEDFEDWRSELSDDEIESLLNYQGRNYALINRFFRDPDGTAFALDDRAFEVVEEVTRPGRAHGLPRVATRDLPLLVALVAVSAVFAAAVALVARGWRLKP